MANNKRKVVIIGLDGASLDLIEPWAREGFLPNFKKMLDCGACGKLRSVVPPHSAPAWSTLYTGRNPGKHGIFDFIAMRQDSYEIVPVSFSDIKAQTFWEAASAYGKRVAVLNAPLTYPPERVNGILVSGLQTPPQAKDFAYPEELAKELDRLVGRYEIYPIEFNSDYQAYLKSLYDVTEKQFKIFLHFLKQNKWDLFMCVFQGTDYIQHHFWQHMDSTHPHYKEENAYKDAIRKYYQRIDTYLGQFIKDFGEQVTLIILSDHGATPLHKYIYINNWLYKWGMIKFKRNFKVLFKKLRFSLPGQSSRGRPFFSFRDIDWPRTKAFTFSNNGQIFINLKTRQPGGCVAPGKEYEQLCNEIIQRLYEIRDPETGEQVIEKAYKRSQIYSEENSSFLPDIFYLFSKGKYLNKGGNKFYSNKLFENCPRQDISGSHGLEGIALFYGNGVSLKQKIRDLAIQDIAPIILAILDVDIPQDMDGKVKPGIFQIGFLKELKYSSVQTVKDRRKHDYTQADTDAIERRLRELGYID